MRHLGTKEVDDYLTDYQKHHHKDKTHPDLLSDCDVFSIESSYGDFDNIIVSRSRLTKFEALGCSFVSASFTGTTFHECVFTECNFTSSDFTGASLIDCTFKDCTFDYANMCGAYFYDCLLQLCSFVEAETLGVQQEVSGRKSSAHIFYDLPITK